MTDPKNPFEAMMAMGQEWAKTLNPALEHFTPKGFEALIPTMPKDMMETVMGKTFNPEGLDAKTKLLLTLGALTILGAQAEAQIRMTVRHALEAGATKQEIAETIALVGVFGGVPAMTKAMELASSVMETGPEDDE
ncbi:MAG: carboxymuconolactone decarboxylase family protein [Erythrobacter sp.]|nr:carboxymuconolactone decarboxylase family protein [Erythrobacter sp.]NND18513.1 carboxymuconolactone decarboxylase family protein [Silicimonas sp.]NNF91657.1 carboxymuconolactone decarboxylase family protein [Boseongicola sp.]RZW05303.1 MAG: carboxymuconolactone decarboxylase family protein [Paracoccaceae bacterium]NNL35177.1 carboxymuconolactone decarboxylase family protein [Silicimonas sp.]